MSIYQTILSRRSIRRFKNIKIPYQILEKCVNAARLAPCSKNLQPWEFVIVDKEDLLPQVFGTLGWASYIEPRGNPLPGEEPRAYIVVLVNKNIDSKWFQYDVGMAIENIILVALEQGVGTCCLANVDRDRLRQILNIPDTHLITLVIALGYPNESPIIEEFTDSVKYWKDETGTLHVPKRRLRDILHRNSYGGYLSPD